MEKDIAREIIKVLLDCRGALAGAADLAREGSEVDESKPFRRTAAQVMMKITDQMMVPLYRQHPELIPNEEREAVEAEIRRQDAGR